MFFKNFSVYRLHPDWAISAEALAEQLQRGPFVKCPSNQPSSRGFVPPRDDGEMVHVFGDQWLIALRVEERILPSSVVADEVKERSEALETQQGYTPSRKQLKELKERVTDELMPKAFVKHRVTYAWINKAKNFIAFDAGSYSRSEEVIEHLRHCLDTFPLAMLNTSISACAAMTDWLSGGNSPAGFTVDRDCELKATGEEKSAVAYKRHALEGSIHEEIKSHIASGKLPTKLALTWDERISFVLTYRLEIKRLAFLDLLMADAEKTAEHASEKFDADLALMTGELTRLLAALVEALGGEEIDLSEQGGGAPAPASVSETQHDPDSDPEYQSAVAIVKSSGRASISRVQRHLRIGYNRAALLIERMEKEGVVSAQNSNGERTVLNDDA